MTNEASSNAIIGNTLRIIASGEYHPGAELTQKMASYIIELEQKLTDMSVQLANAESKCRELAAENAGLKAAFDKPQAYLSWHTIPPTWEDPLPCGEYLDVHDDAGHKNSDGTDCWPVYAKPEIKTPATDTFLAEVRAQGVDIAIAELKQLAHRSEKEAPIAAEHHRSAALYLQLFSSQLRQEPAQ